MSIDSSNLEAKFPCYVRFLIDFNFHSFELSCGVVVTALTLIMLSVVDYSKLFWLLLGVFSYESHEWKSWIF
ncbi:hypothetical protein RIF29_25939 [Crotalaria pallida]|uniref:Uncharacterized protein n=1 Tax=Crotalaria pallida TaxID=3830 RepID=A0AAN9EMT2_CROPI